MRIGIFGGCFNPPHKMHKDIAYNLINKDYLDKVIFVPTGDNYSKPGLVTIDQRIDMLNILLNGENIQVSDLSKDNNYQYTFQVLDYYKTKYPLAELYFICGTDNLDEFETWKRYDYILSNYKLLVIMRNEDNISYILSKYPEYKGNICIANISQNPVSSTLVRNLVKDGDFEKLDKYIDCDVLEYIKNKGLYKN